MSITPYSSRELNALGASMGAYLSEMLEGAESYDRIAGYFSFSILDVVGEALGKVPKVRILCNADLAGIDVALARGEHDDIRLDTALQSEWNRSVTSLMQRDSAFKERAKLAVEHLQSGRLEIRVVGSEKFGLIHAKVGVIRYKNGKRPIAFCGSINETKSAARFNYEAVWSSDEKRLIDWGQAEFDCLWEEGFPLSEAVIEHIRVTANREYLPTVEDWREKVIDRRAIEEGAITAPFVEMPIMASDGLWPHQLFFIDRAFSYHSFDERERSTRKTSARLILADQVGLGKTIQLVAFVILSAIYSKKPALILVPASLKVQWMSEIKSLFAVPAAYWDDGWILEDGTRANKEYDLKNWPRMIGIVSTGMLDLEKEKSCKLLQKNFSVVIVDEAHKSGAKYDNDSVSDKTISYSFLEKLLESKNENTPSVQSCILATATPMQLKSDDPWTLLSLLGKGDYGRHVLGKHSSEWRSADRSEKLIKGRYHPDPYEKWRWISDPGIHPVSIDTMWSSEVKHFCSLFPDLWRNENLKSLTSLEYSEDCALKECFEDYRKFHNPFIENTIFRTRRFLEHKIPKIKVELSGESEPIKLSRELVELRDLVDGLCELLKIDNEGKPNFQPTLFHRRWTSSLDAIKNTLKRFLENRQDDDHPEGYELNFNVAGLSPESREKMLEILSHLENCKDRKQEEIINILEKAEWSDDRVLLFSEYYDTAFATINSLTNAYPEKTVALYSGEERTQVVDGGIRRSVKREELQRLSKEGKIDLLVATKAGQEGLNLQTFGRLINIDLPWNPAHLEQRKGRIQRLGQSRQVIHVHNLWYEDSIEVKVYDRVRERLKKFTELYGVVPETINEDNFDEKEVEEAIANPFKKKYEVEAQKHIRGSGLFALSLDQVCEVLYQEA